METTTYSITRYILGVYRGYAGVSSVWGFVGVGVRALRIRGA